MGSKNRQGCCCGSPPALCKGCPGLTAAELAADWHVSYSEWFGSGTFVLPAGQGCNRSAFHQHLRPGLAPINFVVTVNLGNGVPPTLSVSYTLTGCFGILRAGWTCDPLMLVFDIKGSTCSPFTSPDSIYTVTL